MHINKIAIMLALSVSMAVVSCGEKKVETAAVPPASSEMEACFVAESPSGAVTIEEARKVEPKGKVTVKGTLLGREKIFADKAAIFIIGDPAKIEIEEHEGKPWSACCTPPEIIKANTLTVQFVDKNGKLVMLPAKGVKGLKELDEVIISGEMDASSTSEAPILNIEKIAIIPAK